MQVKCFVHSAFQLTSYQRQREALAPAFSSAALCNFTDVFYQCAYKVLTIFNNGAHRSQRILAQGKLGQPRLLSGLNAGRCREVVSLSFFDLYTVFPESAHPDSPF